MVACVRIVRSHSGASQCYARELCAVLRITSTRTLLLLSHRTHSDEASSWKCFSQLPI
jgi:hypothetical protein